MSAARSTLAAPARLVQEVRKSKFLANAANVASPGAAAEFIARVSDSAATHNCWAYRIGQQYRFSDDGEPAGTAGRPILQAIDSQGLDRIAVVVSRWFGGIKLGAGGLMRTYGGCAAECLRAAAKHELVVTTEIEFTLPFAAVPVLHARLDEFGAQKVDEAFHGEGADLRVRVPADRCEQLADLVRDLSRGRARIRRLDPV